MARELARDLSGSDRQAQALRNTPSPGRVKAKGVIFMFGTCAKSALGVLRPSGVVRDDGVFWKLL